MTFVVSIAGRTESGDELHFLWEYPEEVSEKEVLKNLCDKVRPEIECAFSPEDSNDEIEKFISDDPEEALEEGLVQYEILTKTLNEV